MTTHLTRARWVTAARVPLPRWRTESRHPRPTPAVHSPAYLAAFARFPNKRFIAVGKFERNVKDHLSIFLKLRFHVLQCSRNGTFVRAFVNILSFFWPSPGGSMSETVLHTGYWCARDGVWQVRTALLPLPSAAAHTDWPRAEAPRCRPQFVLSLAAFPTAEALWEAKNSKLFTNARKNVSFLFHRETRNPRLEDTERWYFTLRSNFPTAMSRFFFGNWAKAAK